MDVRSLAEAAAFTTADGSKIRELHGPATSSARNQSLAEATLEPDRSTRRHYHARSEEIYFVLDGEGEMEIDGERVDLVPGDAVLIPPGAWHEIRAGDASRLRFLCACAPPYLHEDAFFD